MCAVCLRPHLTWYTIFQVLNLVVVDLDCGYHVERTQLCRLRHLQCGTFDWISCAHHCYACEIVNVSHSLLVGLLYVLSVGMIVVTHVVLVTAYK